MLYGRKRINFRSSRRTTRIPRPVTGKVASKDTPTYIQCSLPFTWTDNSSFALDLVNSIMTSSTDYAAYSALYAQFKWVSVSIVFQPYLASPFVNTDVSVGMFGVRQGYYEPVPSVLAVNQIAALDTSMPFNNTGAKQYMYFRVTRPEYYDISDGSINNSSTPKITIYGAYSQTASTNFNKGFYQVKVKMVARGRQR